jgi:hypothetical protein
VRSIPIFDTNIFGHAQSGKISPSEWRLLNRHRPGHGWRLSAVSALELLVDLPNLTSEEKFHQFRKRLELAMRLSNGRVLEEPRLLICADVLKVPFPASIPRLPVRTLIEHMQVIRRAQSLKQVHEGFIRWKSRYAKLQSTNAVRNVVTLVKQRWIQQVHQFADGVFPEWRNCYAETGHRLPLAGCGKTDSATQVLSSLSDFVIREGLRLHPLVARGFISGLRAHYALTLRRLNRQIPHTD